MQSQQIDGKHLSYVLVRPDGPAPGRALPVVVLLHGFGASMYDLAGLAPAIDAQGYVYAFPNAPYPLQIAPGVTGYSWLLGRPGVQDPPAGSPDLDEMLDGFFLELERSAGAEPGRMLLGGFSQGGGVTLRYGLPRPGEFAGLAVLSGFFRDFEAMQSSLPNARTQRIFLVHGRHDQLIPLARGQETRAFLEQNGYAPAYQEYDMGHEITAAVIRDLVPWLHETLPPGA